MNVAQVIDATKRKDLATAAAIERQLREAKKDAERLLRDTNKKVLCRPA